MEKTDILKTSESIFFSKRYGDVKLDMIAHELNIQKPSLYHYFKNKQDLFLQVFDYSQKKYFSALESALKLSVKEFISWYLVYPAEEKNLFAISFQKNYCVDPIVRKKIFMGKQEVSLKLKKYFSDFNLDEVQTYLLVNLLEKLAQNNCMDEFCLQFSAEQLADGILQMIEK